MNADDLYKKIQLQFATLIGFFPRERKLKEFLTEKLFLPLDLASLANAREVAHMLLSARTEESAAEELSRNEDRARCFYQFALGQLPSLRDRLKSEAHAYPPGELPFFELGLLMTAAITQQEKTAQDSEAIET